MVFPAGLRIFRLARPQRRSVHLPIRRDHHFDCRDSRRGQPREATGRGIGSPGEPAKRFGRRLAGGRTRTKTSKSFNPLCRPNPTGIPKRKRQSRQWPMRVPTGRSEPRTARAVTVELLRLDDSQCKEEAVTENLSPRGARVLTESTCARGKHVLFTSPQEGVKSLARVVYCERAENRRFAVGLQLVVRVEEWAKGC
jgi:hypothetical protein